MEFSIKRNIFLSGIQNTLGITEKNLTTPIFSNILIKTKTDGIKILAVNRELSLVADYDADIIAPGEIAVSGKKLFEMVRALTGDVVKFSSVENNRANVTCEKVTYKIPGISPDDFPELVDDVDVDFIKIECGVLRNLIGKTFFAISDDETRPSLNGVYFKIDGGLINMVSTDGHRLSVAGIKNDQNLDCKIDGMIIPKRGISEIRKLITDEDMYLEIGKSKNICIVRINSMVLRVSLIDAEYPDYIKAIPGDMNVGIKLKRNKILDSLKRMNVVYSDRFSGVRIQLFKDKMVLILVNPDLGEAMDEIDIMYDGDDLEVGYNVRYLIDAIDVIKEDDILFEIKDESGPGIIRSTENDEYICVVMPIKLRKD